MRRRGFFLMLGLIGFVLEARAEVVSPQALVRAHRDGEVAVVVQLKRRAVSDPRSATTDQQRSALLMERRREIARQRRAVIDSVRKQDLEVLHEYQAVAGFSAVVSEAGLAELVAHPEVERIDVDADGEGLLSRSVPQIRADRVHNRGVTGAGTVVAVIDSGVVADHPDVAGSVIHEECFCFNRCCPGDTRRASGPGSAFTRNDHGMHVTGILLSAGNAAPAGVAPGLRLVAIRVLRDSDLRGHTSDWLAALDWILTERPDVRVVNMSLGTLRLFAGSCDRTCHCLDCGGGEELTLCATNRLFGELIEMLKARGTMVFVASGNDENDNALTSPGCVEGAQTIGAVDRSDEVAVFSNSEPGLDFLAPGVAIESSSTDPSRTRVDSGTSMATPHAAGVAALLLSASPGATVNEVESTMSVTGVPVRDARNGLIFPRVDAFAAFQAITRRPELQRGGGSRDSDCLVEWSFTPPAIADGGKRPIARCTDGDAACDADTINRQCTFLVSLCFNSSDPLTRSCRTDEDVLSLALRTPREASPDELDRLNAANLQRSLPSFPIRSSNVCGVPFPFVVRRPAARDGIAEMQLRADTATRDDYDRFALICEAP